MKKFYDIHSTYSFNSNCCRYTIGVSDYYDMNSTKEYFVGETKHTPKFHKKILHLFIFLAK